MLKEIRQQPLINRFFSKIFKYWTYSFRNQFKDKVISRWSVSGEFSTTLKDDLSFKYYSNCDDQIANLLYYDIKEYSEYHELLLFSALAKRSSVILDIGANTGIFSTIAGLSQPAARIFAFEPYKINAARFRKNMEINGITNVSLEPVALGSSGGFVNFTVPDTDQICDVLSVNSSFSKNFYQDEMSFHQEEVAVTTVDQFVAEKSLNGVDLIKIDVESYEMEVFKGAGGMLERFSPVIMCEIFPDNERITFFKEFLKPRGYSCYLIFPHGLVKSAELINNRDCRNYLFTKNDAGRFYYSFQEMDTIVKDLMGK